MSLCRSALRAIAPIAAAGLLLASCTVGPDYEPPEMTQVPDVWKSAVARELDNPPRRSRRGGRRSTTPSSSR